MSLPKYAHIIWDWNGTLLDDVQLCVELINDMLRRRHMPLLDLQRYRQAFDIPVINFYRNIGFEFVSESFEKVGSEFIGVYTDQWRRCRLYTGATQALQALARTGIDQHLLSAASQHFVDEGVDHFGIRGYFAELIGRDDHYARSKVDIAQQLIHRLKCEPRDVLFIGDTSHDYQMARAVDADCLLLTAGHNTRRTLLACGAPVVESLGEVVDFLIG